MAGVYNNVIRGNVVTNNGVAGEGAGVLFANAAARHRLVRQPGHRQLHRRERVFSGGTPVTVTIALNHIFNNHFGIWLSKPVIAAGLATNTFTNVTTPVSAGH